MDNWLGSIVDFIYDNTLGKLTDFLQDTVLNILNFFISLVNNANLKVWENPVISAILSLVPWMCVIIMVATIPFLLMDILQQLDSLEGKSVLFSLAKGYIFSSSALIIATAIFTSSFSLVSELNMEIDIKGFNLLGNIFATIIMLIGVVVFGCLSFGCCASMIMHIISSPFYVPYIVKGDKQKLQEWVFTAFVFAVAYFLQYLFFYIGTINIMASNEVTAIVCYLICFKVQSSLQPFKLSSNGGLNLSSSLYSTSMAAGGIQRLMKGG